MTARAARFPLFDSLRAIAVLSVFAYHALGQAARPGSDAALRPLIANLSVGVSIFFVISGFLLYRPVVGARLRGVPWLPLRVYAWRRVLRIVPAYWVALVVFALWLGTPGIFSPEGILRYWLFGQVYDQQSALGGISQAWSLDVEVVFYAFLPALAFVMRAPPGRDRAVQLRQEWGAIVLLFMAGLAFNALMLAHAGEGRYTTALHTFPSFLDHFVLGMALAVASSAFEGRPTPRALRPFDRFPALAWALALAAYLGACFAFGNADRVGEINDAEFLARRVLFALVAAFVVLPAVFGKRSQGLVRRLLAAPALMWIGLISYSLFLYHTAVIVQLDRWDFGPLAGLHPYLVVLDALLPALVVAAAGYYLVERPALRFKRALDPSVECATSEPTPTETRPALLGAGRSEG